MFWIFPISPSEWGLESWAAGRVVTCETACWWEVHCPAGTPSCRHGFVEKTAVCYAPTWSDDLSGHKVYNSEITGQPVSVSYLTPLELSVESRTLSQQKLLIITWGLLTILLQALVDSSKDVVSPCLQYKLIGISQQHQSALENI